MGCSTVGVEEEEVSPNVPLDGVCGSVEDIMLSWRKMGGGQNNFYRRSFYMTIATIVAENVLSYLPRALGSPPLFVALQGPQGSGKTHLSRSLVSILASPPHSLRAVVLSVDDLYLTHDVLCDLTNEHPFNKLWKGRGQPGTHDVTLGTEVFRGLHEINAQVRESGSVSKAQVNLPVFDKSRFSGEGDRASEVVVVSPPVDIVIFEGWCVGFYPLTREALDAKWESVQAGIEVRQDGIIWRAMDGVRKEDLEAVNEALRKYVDEWYSFFEVFVRVSGFLPKCFMCLFELFYKSLPGMERFDRRPMRHISIYTM